MRNGVATIRLRPIARLRRNQRRRHHVAPMAEACELAMNAITARSGLITKRQQLAGTPETPAQLADCARIVGNLAEVFPRPRASFLRHRDGDPYLCEYPSQQVCSIGPSPMHEALCRPGGLTLVALPIAGSCTGTAKTLKIDWRFCELDDQSVLYVLATISRKGGGVSEAARLLVLSLSRKLPGRVSVLTTRDEYSQQDRGGWGEIPITFARAFPPRNFGFSPGLLLELLRRRPSVVHLHGLWM